MTPSAPECWCPNRADGRRHPFLPGRGVGLCGDAPVQSEFSLADEVTMRTIESGVTIQPWQFDVLAHLYSPSTDTAFPPDQADS